MIDNKNGNITLCKDISVSPQTTYGQLRSAFPENKIWEVGTGYFWFYFTDILIDEKIFDFSFCFCGEKLEMIIFLFREKYESAPCWENFSQEKELQKKKKFEQWLTEKIGEKRKFSWGKINAYYHPQDASAKMVLTYF